MNPIIMLAIGLVSAFFATIIAVIILSFIRSFFEDREMSVEVFDNDEVERLKKAGL
jgi:hypothetical protein